MRRLERVLVVNDDDIPKRSDPRAPGAAAGFQTVSWGLRRHADVMKRSAQLIGSYNRGTGGVTFGPSRLTVGEYSERGEFAAGLHCGVLPMFPSGRNRRHDGPTPSPARVK